MYQQVDLEQEEEWHKTEFGTFTRKNPLSSQFRSFLSLIQVLPVASLPEMPN